ncbi:MAG: sigma-70 family RNA polymerase sigma factor [Oscillospiraceae bacterium]|nr:sigma-70 family RNA polymerase sigma factor [Oscillospiraceae bacterium]
MDKKKLTEVVKSAQTGDNTALETLYREYTKPVYFLALKILANKEDSEDITQEVFIHMFQKIADLKNPETFPTWLNRITSNKCTDFLRKKRVTLNIEDEEIAQTEFFEESDPLLVPEKALDNAETVKLITDIIDNLPLPQRVCVYYYYYEHLTIAQIAENLGANESTVKNRLALAREKIRKAIESLEKKDGIKLYGVVPLMITPILRIALQQFQMPQGSVNEMLGNITAEVTATVAETAGTASTTTTATAGTTSTATTGTAGTTITTTTATAGTASTATSTAISMKSIIALIAAIAVVAGIGITAFLVLNSGNEDVPADLEVVAGANEDTETPAEPLENIITTEPETENITETEPEIIKIEIDLSGKDITNEQLAELVANGEIPKNVTHLKLGIFIDEKAKDEITESFSGQGFLSQMVSSAESYNQITDITPLAELTDLIYLDLSGSGYSFGNEFGNPRLEVFGNQIIDISALSELTNLTHLYLGNNQIIDIAPLSRLNNLTVLDLGSNQINDITPLSELNNLTTLDLRKNEINDISSLTELNCLTELILRSNKIEDVISLAELINLTELDLWNCTLNEEKINALQATLPQCNIKK